MFGYSIHKIISQITFVMVASAALFCIGIVIGVAVAAYLL